MMQRDKEAIEMGPSEHANPGDETPEHMVRDMLSEFEHLIDGSQEMALVVVNSCLAVAIVLKARHELRSEDLNTCYEALWSDVVNKLVQE